MLRLVTLQFVRDTFNDILHYNAFQFEKKNLNKTWVLSFLSPKPCQPGTNWPKKKKKKKKKEEEKKKGGKKSKGK